VADDVLGEFESVIASAEAADRDRAEDPTWSPWDRAPGEPPSYTPNVALLRDLLTGPMSAGASTQSGRLAKAFDAWMSYELRRGGFRDAEVWPRNRAPRVSWPEIEQLTVQVERLLQWVEDRDVKADKAQSRKEISGDVEAVAAAAARLDKEHKKRQRSYEQRLAAHAKKVAEAREKGTTPPDPPVLELPDRVTFDDPLLPGLRAAIGRVAAAMPRVNVTNVLGRYYVKQVDVVVGSWDRGPDVLISGKTMFSSFAKNTKNRYEETLGEAANLRDRYPLAAMGYAFLVRDTIFEEAGAYGRLQDLLLRTRKPYGPYDATMLLIATWDEHTRNLSIADPLTYPDPAVSDQNPPVDLSPSRFYTDLFDAVISNTPVGVHEEVRVLRNGTRVPGGTPDPNAESDEE
jgi:hypothetical protein